ncbi:MAG: prepilin-type N-terminal cleavage/methylation domain-containing protein [Gemmatimonadetes bacterium]|nr:prepilin-type N-terminal cleavage/methylation domain-containing protein [Gemmatimonadota bacterium]
MTTTRRGFTLIELMLALVVMSIVAGAITKFFINSQRLSRAQVETIGMQSNLRTGALVVPTELRELSVSGGSSDILAMNSSDITFRAMRGLGFTCSVTPTQIKILDTGTIPFYGFRYVALGQDQVVVFVENDPDTPTDDDWLILTPTAVDLTNNCGPLNAIKLTFNNFSGLLPNGISDIVLGGPVRSFEIMHLGSVVADGYTWLGARSVSGGQPTLLPVIGPLTASGFQLEYFDVAGNPTTVTTAVRSIRVTLVGMTEHAVSRGLGDNYVVKQDTLVATVNLRNAD